MQTLFLRASASLSIFRPVSARPERNGTATFQQERPWTGPQRAPYPKVQKEGIRYFIIKSVSHRNIATSIEKGVWATQAINEAKLNQAFEVRDRQAAALLNK